MRKHILAASLAATAMLAAPVYAFDFGKPIHTPIKVTSKGRTIADETQQVTIMQVKLSKKGN